MSDDFDVRELVCMLSPHAIDMSKMARGHVTLTPQDIAARLSRCSPMASNLARAKYANDDRAYNVFYWQFAAAASGPPKGPSWPRKLPKGVFSGMVNLVLTETLLPSKCPVCNGTSPEVVKIVGKTVVCVGCNNTGKVNYSDRLRARLLGMPFTSYRRLIPQHTKLMDIMHDLEVEIVDALLERSPVLVHGVANPQHDDDPPPVAA